MTPLHQVGDFLRELFARIPLPVVRGLFLAVPTVLLIWVLLLPRRMTTPDETSVPSAHWSNNLKLWAGLALVIQMVIYWLF